MAGAYQYTPKRPYSSDVEGIGHNGQQKKRAASNPGLSAEASDETVYRILCPASKVGGIIGKGGNVIKALKHETRSRITVEEGVYGSDERVIYISSSAKGTRDGEPKGLGSDDIEEEMRCAAQEALFRVHAKIIEVDNESGEPPSSVTIRLLVPNNQTGCLLGKGGKIIEQMRKEIGGQIRVMPKEQVPACALPNDEIVQLSGDIPTVRKALYAVSTRLHDNPPRERLQGFGHSFPPLGNTVGGAWPFTPGFPVELPTGGPKPLISDRSPGEQFIVRMLCPNDKMGGVIGKGGALIRRLREETGAKINIGEPIANSDERVINISSKEYLENTFSPAIGAALQIQMRLADLLSDKDTEVASVTTRLLVSSSQIGCLLGKGGHIISEMRKLTRAKIKIPSKSELPACAEEKDELVQISGAPHIVQTALLQVLEKLRYNLFKSIHTGNGIVSGAPLPSSASGFSSYGGRHELGSHGTLYPLPSLDLSHGSSYGGYNYAPVSTFSATGEQRDSRRKEKF